jgi:hypothetical protein
VPGSWTASVGVIAALLGSGSALGAAPAALAAGPAISLEASPQQLPSGKPVTLSGEIQGVPPGTVVELQASRYPYVADAPAGTTSTGADGSYSFTASPDRDARYRAVLADGTTSATVEVDVTPVTVVKTQAVGLSRAQVTVVIFHPRDLAWAGSKVSWRFTSASGAPVTPASSTVAALSPYVGVLKQTVTLPPGAFRWTACFTAPGDHALLDPGRPPGCQGRGYQGDGSLPVGLPDPGAVARSARYLAGRTGRTAFAVLDSQGRLSGTNVHSTFFTASVVKAMMLVAYLRRLDARGQRRVDGYSNSFLYPMIHVSDNNAATHCWLIVGNAGLYAVARAAHMTDFSVSGLWGSALLSPADQARFFFEMDSLIPKEFVGYARFLLSTIEPSQSWAIPAVARPLGYRVFFKDGSEPTASGQLVHQIARLEGHGVTFSLAVMTDGDPTMQYGIDTIAGVTRALLG